MRLTSFGHAALLADTGSERILIDPWLTARLDRFWERSPAMPPGLESELADGVDAIILSHHHFDHHHFPSLAELAKGREYDFDETMTRRSEILCVYPRHTSMPPRYSASGLGHQTIAWTLRRLGFTRTQGVTPGETIRIGRTVITTFPSRVPFPEMSLLIQGPDATVMVCGDAVLHPEVTGFFARPARPRVDVAFIPAHSVAPRGVLTERHQVSMAAEVVSRAENAFLRYCETISPGIVIPSSFGWKVRGESFDWANKTIFPFTPVQAAAAWRRGGGHAALCGAGQVVDTTAGEFSLSRTPYLMADHDFDAICAAVSFDPATKVPPLDPATDTFGHQRAHPDDLAARLCDELVGTDLWHMAAESGRSHVLEIACDDGDHAYLLDLAGQRTLRQRPGTDLPDSGFTRISGATLQALMDSELLVGSSYGLWVSNDNLLSAVFHHPRYYVRHVEKQLRQEAQA